MEEHYTQGQKSSWGMVGNVLIQGRGGYLQFFRLKDFNQH